MTHVGVSLRTAPRGEYDHERVDLHNVIEDQRHLRLRTPSPPRQSLVEGVAPVEKNGFRALAGPLRQV
jgi:hypothetical protein